MESGSKIEVHTVLKLMALAITAMYASSGASSGVATSPTWSDLRGSLSSDVDALEHGLLVPLDEGGPVGVGKGDGGDLLAGCAGEDGGEEFLHGGGG